MEPLDGKEGAERINPYDSEGNKGEQVEKMFDSIAPAYDFMNTAMTLGLHRRWRDKALKSALKLLPYKNLKVLDVATGTGDVALRIAGMLPEAEVTGIDLSAGMLEKARTKLAKYPDGIRSRITFEKADCLSLPYGDGQFQLITVAYGVRNFENLLQGLREMRRVLSRGGVLCIVELSCPTGVLTSLGYKLYTRTLIPGIGRIISGDSRAYTYLPESIAAAPQREAMAEQLRKAGFNDVKWRALTFGAVTYYLAK